MVAQSQAIQSKEKKDHVSFHKDNGQYQITNLSPNFSLKKNDMYSQKQPFGIDSFPERMQQIQNDIRGPKPTHYRLAQMVRVSIKDLAATHENFGESFLKNMERSYNDYQ